MKKKTILFVVNNFDIGGPQKSLLSLLYRIDLEKYDVSLLSLSGEGDLFKFLPLGVKVIPPDPLITYATLPPVGFVKKTLNIILSTNYKLALNALYAIILGLTRKNMVKEKQKFWMKVKKRLPLLNSRFDVAIGVSGGHSMMYITDCVDAKKRVGWVRSDYRVLNRNHEIDKIYFENMDEILSVSKICKDIFIELFPETTSKIKVMYNVLPFSMYENIPAETNLLKRENNEHILLTICRLDPHKGLDLAIDAMEILLKKNLNVKWYILGGGAHKKEIENLIVEKKLEKRFILLGFQINTAEFIKKADIVVHPSRFEGKSNVVDEAKYLLKPIVATKYETVHEQLTHEKTGIISEMDSHSLAFNIERLIKMDTEKFQKNLLKERYDDAQSLKVFQEVISN